MYTFIKENLPWSLYKIRLGLRIAFQSILSIIVFLIFLYVTKKSWFWFATLWEFYIHLCAILIMHGFQCCQHYDSQYSNAVDIMTVDIQMLSTLWQSIFQYVEILTVDIPICRHSNQASLRPECPRIGCWRKGGGRSSWEFPGEISSWERPSWQPTGDTGPSPGVVGFIPGPIGTVRARLPVKHQRKRQPLNQPDLETVGRSSTSMRRRKKFMKGKISS